MACFRLSGNNFVLMLRFKIWVKGAAIMCELSRSILALRSSSPVAFEISRLDNWVYTYDIVMACKSNVTSDEILSVTNVFNFSSVYESSLLGSV